MPAVARQLAASPYLERDSSDEEDEDNGKRKPRSGAGKPSQPVLRVGGRAVSRRGVQASRRKATRKQPPNRIKEEEEALDDSWTTIPSKTTKASQPQVEEDAEGDQTQDVVVALELEQLRRAQKAQQLKPKKPKLQASRLAKPTGNTANRRQRVLQQPGFSSAMQRAPAPRQSSQY